MNLCIECKHCHAVNRCAAPNAMTRSPVNGRTEAGFCEYLRAYAPGCGPEGKWFEPRHAESVRALAAQQGERG